MKKKLLILGTGTDQVEGIQEANKMGLYTIGLDGNEKSDGASLVDEFYKVNIKDINAVLDFVNSYSKSIDSVIAFGVDIPDILAKVAEVKGLYFHLSYEMAKLSKNKYLARQLLKESGVNVPPFCGVRTTEDVRDFIKKRDYPVLLKPVDNSASRGVLLISEKTDLEWAFSESSKFVLDKTADPPLIVEKFIHGQQLSTESIIYQNSIYTVGLSDRNYELLEKYAPFVVENGGDLPPRLLVHKTYEELIKAIDREIIKAARAFNAGNGTVKGDVVIDGRGKVWVIEVAFRLSGGLLSTLEIPLNTEINFIKEAIKIRLFNECNVEQLVYRIKNRVRLRYIFLEKEKGILKKLRLPEVKNTKIKVYCKVGEDIGRFFEIYKLPLIKLIGFVTWGKSKEEIVKQEKEFLEKLDFLVQ